MIRYKKTTSSDHSHILCHLHKHAFCDQKQKYSLAFNLLDEVVSWLFTQYLLVSKLIYHGTHYSTYWCWQNIHLIKMHAKLIELGNLNQWCLQCFTVDLSLPLLSSGTDINWCVFSRWWLHRARVVGLYRIHYIGVHWCAAGFQCGWISVCLQRTSGKMHPTLELEIKKQLLAHY